MSKPADRTHHDEERFWHDFADVLSRRDCDKQGAFCVGLVVAIAMMRHGYPSRKVMQDAAQQDPHVLHRLMQDARVKVAAQSEGSLMPTKRGLRKLCDVWGSYEAAARVHAVLDGFLRRHHIDHELSGPHEDPYGRPYWRYKVQARDLCCAQAVLGAVKELHKGAFREAS